MDRRLFLQLLGAAVAAPAIPPVASAEPAAQTAALKGVQTIFVPEAAMLARSMFTVRLPKDWDQGVVTFEPIWSSAKEGEEVSFRCSAAALPEDESGELVFGKPVTAVDSCLAAGDMHIVTSDPLGVPSSDIAVFKVETEGEAVLHGVKLILAP